MIEKLRYQVLTARRGEFDSGGARDHETIPAEETEGLHRPLCERSILLHTADKRLGQPRFAESGRFGHSPDIAKAAARRLCFPLFAPACNKLRDDAIRKSVPNLLVGCITFRPPKRSRAFAFPRKGLSANAGYLSGDFAHTDQGRNHFAAYCRHLRVCIKVHTRSAG